MSRLGVDKDYDVARNVLISTLELLAKHFARSAIVVTGAQAIYLQCDESTFSRAPFTYVSDLVINPKELGSIPAIKTILSDAGYKLKDGQPGMYLAPGLPEELQEFASVDLIVPEEFAFGTGHRDARLPGDNRAAARRTAGLELTLFDNEVMDISSIDGVRAVQSLVAGRTALTVAKLYKVGERLATPKRLKGKDVADIYRLLQSAKKSEIPSVLTGLREKTELLPVISQARVYLEDIFMGSDPPGFTLLRSDIESTEEFEIARGSMNSLVKELFAEWPA